ncbi:MAG: E3 binding domain-containing protein [Candidatus Manganitrophus sp.]|nr:E3 binding domain-containing protein [Candidatus Manganitrophus sp.]
MRKEFKFPDVGEGITEGELVKWLVSQGESVKEDQPLVEVETDKAVVTLPSPYTGKVIELRGKPGEVIQVGSVLVAVETEEASAPKTTEKKPTAEIKKEETRKDAGSVVGRLGQEEEEFKVRAIPSVRARAKELGVDLSKVRGTGPNGRLTREDVEQAAQPRKEAAPIQPLARTEAGTARSGRAGGFPGSPAKRGAAGERVLAESRRGYLHGRCRCDRPRKGPLQEEKPGRGARL